jgi:type II secretory pathway component GspD/PulD (secretin)
MILAMAKPRRHLAFGPQPGRLAVVLQRLAALALALFLVTVPASPQSKGASSPRPDKSRAQKAYREGQRAEQSGDWKTAYAAYSDATTYAPANKEYPLLKEHARFQVIQGLMDSAERQAIAGNVTAARGLLTQALKIDPNYVVVRERLAELSPDSVEVAPEKGPRLAGPPRLHTKPGTQDFDYRGTTRGAYDELGRQFGVTMVFDGDLADRSIRFEIPKVDFDTALMVLSRQTQTFTRVVDDYTLFVTEDTPQKERDYAVEIEKSLVLPASVTTDEMNETVRMIREMTGITRTQLDAASHTLTIRSTEQNVALAQALLEQIEQPHGEMLLEVEILEMDRNAAEQMGITPPASAQILSLGTSQIQQLKSAVNTQALLQVIQSLFGGSGALSTASGALGTMLPPLIAFGGGKTIFLATVPGATANFSQTIGAVRSARRILLRAQDGKAATFFVGDRYPVSLALLSSNVSAASSALAAGVVAGLLPRTDYNTGKSPVALALADFNGDGHPDIAVANQADNTISIFLGAGDGTFPTRTDISVGNSPSGIAVGDFNDDNNIDIAVTNSGDNTVSILLGKGDGTFATPVTYPTGNTPVALLAKDFDGDGVLDLAVVNQGDGTVSILRKATGSPNGTFGSKTDYPVGTMPTAIASADFNGDGTADLAVTNFFDNTVTVLFGKSDGTFGGVNDGALKPITLATGKGPSGIAPADFNNDSHTDLAVTNKTDSTVSILFGKGDGTFGLTTDGSLSPKTFGTHAGPVGISAADFTGGGNQDLVVTDETANSMDLLVGNGDGTFPAPVSLASGNGPVAVVAADLNGDSTIDAVVANESSNTISVTLNTLETPAGTSNPAQTAYPSSEYEDLGLKLKATPWLHSDDEVTLQLEFDIRSLAGPSINGIPVLSNRTIEQTVRLRENESSVLSGIIQSNDIRSISGWPGVSKVPGVEYLTGENIDNSQQTETFIVITPRALRYPPHNVPALYAGHGEPTTPPELPPPQGGPPQLQPPGQQPVPGQIPAPGGPANQVPGQPQFPPGARRPPPGAAAPPRPPA